MRDDYPEYTPTVGVQVSSSNAPMAQADDAEAQLAGQVASKVSRIGQNEIDKQESLQAAQDAKDKGLAWTPKSNLTETGRAYNQAGKQVALNIGTADMANHMSGLYNQTLNQPAGQGGLQSFQKSAQSYFNQQLQATDPSLQPALTKSFQAAYMAHSNQIAQREAKYSRAQSIESLSDTYTSLSNQAGAMGSQAMESTDPVKQDMLLKQSHNFLTQSEIVQGHISAMSGNAVQSGIDIRNGKLNYIKSILMGQQRGLFKLADNTSSDTQKADYLNKAGSMSTDLMNNKNVSRILNSLNMNSDITANQKFALSRELSRNYNSYQSAQKATHGKNQEAISNAILAANQGKQVGSDVEAMMTTKQVAKLHGAQSSYTLLNNIKSMPIDNAVAWMNKYQDKDTPLQLPGLDAYTNEQVKTNVLSKVKTYIADYKSDPAKITMKSSEFNSYLNNAYTKMGDSQSEVSTSVNTPFYYFNHQLSPDAKTNLSATYDQMKHLQSAKDIQNTSVMPKSMAQSIASQLSNDPTQRVQQLLMAKQNTQGHWGDVQKALLNTKKVPYDDFISVGLYKNPNAQTTATDLISAAASLKDNPKEFWSATGVTQNKAMQDVMGDSTFKNAVNSLTQYPGAQANHATTSLARSIANLAAYNMQNDGHNWKEEGDDSSYVSDAAKSVINGLYQHGASEGFRVPYTVDVKAPDGSTKSEPLDYGTTKNIMKFMQKNTAQFEARGKDLPSNGKWMNTPNGSGMVLVDKNRHPFYFKNGKPYGFTFTQAANPGSIPGYNAYDEKNTSFIKRFG